MLMGGGGAFRHCFLIRILKKHNNNVLSWSLWFTHRLPAYFLLYESNIAPFKYYWPMFRLGDGNSDLYRHDWQVNTIDGLTKLVRQDAILGGLSTGQLNLDSIYHVLFQVVTWNPLYFVRPYLTGSGELCFKSGHW